MGLFSNLFNKQSTKSAIKLAYDNISVIGEQRHVNNWFIINNYALSDKPLDILAVAVAFEGEGASHRKDAIKYYEKFLQNPDVIPDIPHSSINGNAKKMFSNWSIYSSLANLYEKEYQFDKSIYYLNKLPKESCYNNVSDYTRVGDVLAKIDINECVKYYEKLKTQSIYAKFKKSFDSAYHSALEKQKKGYKFKPRIKKE